MPRYIDADKLITDIQGIASEVCMKSPYDPEWFTRLHDMQKEIIKIIEIQPKADVEQVRHGEWIDEYDGKYANPRYTCSNCKGKALYDVVRDELGNWKEVQVLTEHCPHCGAIMDEVK